MQQIATYETVARACERLNSEGQKVTGRAVLSITGGSLGRVLGFIKEWRQGATQALTAMPSEIPAELQTAILRALGLAQEEALAKIKEETEQAALREAEAFEGLAEAERRIDDLAAKLARIQKQSAEDLQTSETATAVTTEKIESMRIRIEALETERRQLIEAAEASRTEAAKALVQVERADKATGKAEAMVQKLDAQLSTVQNEKVSAEKAAAVAEQKNQDQTEILAETRASLAELKKDSRETIADQKQEMQALRKKIADHEKQIAVLLVEKAEIAKSLALSEERARNIPPDTEKTEKGQQPGNENV